MYSFGHQTYVLGFHVYGECIFLSQPDKNSECNSVRQARNDQMDAEWTKEDSN